MSTTRALENCTDKILNECSVLWVGKFIHIDTPLFYISIVQIWSLSFYISCLTVFIIKLLVATACVEKEYSYKYMNIWMTTLLQRSTHESIYRNITFDFSFWNQNTRAGWQMNIDVWIVWTITMIGWPAQTIRGSSDKLIVLKVDSLWIFIYKQYERRFSFGCEDCRTFWRCEVERGRATEALVEYALIPHSTNTSISERARLILCFLHSLLLVFVKSWSHGAAKC